MSNSSDFSFNPLLLKELHLLTKDGKLNQDASRKLKQINHLLQFMAPTLKRLLEKSKKSDQTFSVTDLGAGKSYFGFLLYDYFFKNESYGELLAIESRPDLIQKSLLLKESLNFSRMKFIESKINSLSEAELHSVDSADAKDEKKNINIPQKTEVIVALHACDTATDDAIKFGLSHHAEAFFLIPCCQAEVARLLNEEKESFISEDRIDVELFRKPLHTREFGSHLTNVLRCLWLEASGYQVNVTEFTGFEHSLKNELIIAEKKGEPMPEKKEKLRRFLKTYHLEKIENRFF